MRMAHPAKPRPLRSTLRGRAVVSTQLLLLLTMPVLAGCDTGTAPDDMISGTFALRAVNGQPLPVTFQSREVLLGPVVEISVLGDTIELRSDGTGEQRGTGRRRELPDTLTTVSDDVLRFRHRLNGDQLVLDSLTCVTREPGTTCAVLTARLTLRYRAGELISLTSLFTEPAPSLLTRVYQRIPPN